LRSEWNSYTASELVTMERDLAQFAANAETRACSGFTDSIGLPLPKTDMATGVAPVELAPDTQTIAP
jgi:hypothetical protein